MFVKLTIWMVNRAFNRKKREAIEPTIKELYRKMAIRNLKIKTEIVKVKKGKNRYDLLFFETPSGEQRVNLGRHFAKNERMEVVLN